MKILLDECVDRNLARLLTGHVVTTVPEAGWAGLTNGALLQLANDAFDIFLTTDRGIMHQQALAPLSIKVVVMIGKSNSIRDLRGGVPLLLAALENFGELASPHVVDVTQEPPDLA